ncbi:MAG: hypothetical protein ACFE9Q_13070 [Candidatus Hodarchaeota archaeon]
MSRVLDQLGKENKEFFTSEELKKHCEDLYIDYRRTMDYLTSRGHLVNIIEDIYYMKTISEIRKNHLKYSILEFVAKGLKLKKIDNWYFGLYTALNINNIKHNHKDKCLYLINDYIFKNQPIKILGKMFRFLRFKNALFNFGIIQNKIRYSDHEKTILDLIYLWEFNHLNENRILIEVSKLLEGISEEKILQYAQYYPDSNQKLLKKAIEKS